jgi:hypothetical protein
VEIREEVCDCVSDFIPPKMWAWKTESQGIDR